MTTPTHVDGDYDYMRVQDLTNQGALDCDKQLAVVREFTEIVARSADDAGLAERTWVVLTEAPDGSWGLHGQAYTKDALIAAARKAMLGS